MPRVFVYNISMLLWNLSALFSDPLGTLKQLACMIPIMLFSLTLHEWGHAYAAHKCGDDTARNLGRMTLNPLAHLDPIGTLMMLFSFFGYAKPVPVNPRNFRNYKRGEAIVSLAGVFMNFLLVIAFCALIVLFNWMSYRFDYSWLNSNVLWIMLQFGLLINLSLMLFNLLPVYPLDGFHVFELLFARRLPANVFLFLRRYGILILFCVLFVLYKFNPVSYLYNWILNKLSELTLLLI